MVVNILSCEIQKKLYKFFSNNKYHIYKEIENFFLFKNKNKGFEYGLNVKMHYLIIKISNILTVG